MADFCARVQAENAELVGKLAELAGDEEVKAEVMRELNYDLKTRIAKQQKAAGEPTDPVGLSPKEMKELRKAFTKFDTNGDGFMDAGELAQLASDLAEPLSEEEIQEGMKAMDAAGTGKIEFENFVSWISDERDKESHKGMKMRMLKLKMRASHLHEAVKKGLARVPSNKEYVAAEDDVVSVSASVGQGVVADNLTKIALNWNAQEAASGRAAMDALGAPADAASCVCINLSLLDGVDESATEELQGIYDMIFEMANGEELIAERGDQIFLHGKPSLRIADAPDGSGKVLQLLVCFSFDPFSQFQLDSRFLKTISAQVDWAHLVDEVIKEEGEQIDLLALEGLNADFKMEIDRKILEFLSADEQLRGLILGAIGEEEVLAHGLAAALVFGSIDFKARGRSVMEVFNQEIRDNLEVYNEFLEEYEDRRYIPAEMLEEVTKKIADVYSQMPGPAQKIYLELKSKLAGPHSVQVIVPTGVVDVSTKGLHVLHKFFPTEEKLEDYNDGDGEEW